jgi:hypothetical protein
MTALPALFSLSLATLATVSFASPAAAQDPGACANEVQHLSEVFRIMGSNGQAPAVSGQQPGDRIGAGLSAEQTSQMRDLIEQGRIAGEQGNGALCGQKLEQARTLLREAGVGSDQPGPDDLLPADPLDRRGSSIPPGGTQGVEIPATPPPR